MTAVEITGPVDGQQFIVASEVMSKFMTMVERVARHVGTVLVTGETGSGKEMVVRAIHQQSLRCTKSFVEINCAALPENLVESELFGYEKGAFSGADSAKPGLFELAHLGTIFLDEIGELDPRIQVKLLRVLDRAPYYRLGGHRKITTDVRIVAATNRDLKEEVKTGRFRKDLYHRLSQFELSVPPLRQRHEDITALAKHFLSLQRSDVAFSTEALRVMQSYEWPGNVRELQNVVNKVGVLASGPEISATEVSQEFTSEGHEATVQVDTTPVMTRLDGLEEQAIKKALAHTKGHRGHAAEELGISRRTLSRKLREYGLSTPRSATKSMGLLGEAQQRSFRVPVQVPVKVQSGNTLEVDCVSVNLSADGMGVEGLAVPLPRDNEFCVRFQLPDSGRTAEVSARTAWANSQGRAGILFTSVSAEVSREINSFVRKKMAEEGWTFNPQKPDTYPLTNKFNAATPTHPTSSPLTPQTS